MPKLRDSGGRPATSIPSTQISPRLGVSKPATIISVVVLPEREADITSRVAAGCIGLPNIADDDAATAAGVRCRAWRGLLRGDGHAGSRRGRAISACASNVSVA